MILDSIFVKVLVTVLAAVLVVGITAFGKWVVSRYIKPGLRITITKQHGPIVQQLGFAEPAIAITIRNTTNKAVVIRYIQLMFSRQFGFPVLPDAHPPFSHPNLPAKLESYSEEHWYIPAEQFSSLIRRLLKLEPDGFVPKSVKVHVRCTLGSDRVLKSESLNVTTDPNEHWP